MARPPFLIRVLTRLFLALATLLAMRLIFAAARRMHRVDGGDGGPDHAHPDRAVGGTSGGGRVTGSGSGTGRPRIDRAAAEDVPYVEVDPETVRRG